MNKVTVAMFNLNETRRDPRVRRVAKSLVSQGFKVIVFGMRIQGMPQRESFEGYEIVRVEIPSSRDRKDMEAFGRICPEAAEAIRKSNPQVLDYDCSKHRLFLSRLRRKLEKSLNFLSTVGESGRRSYPVELIILDIRYIMLLNLAMYQAACEFSPTVAHCNDLDTLLCGFMMKTVRKIPLVYDSHEIYTEQPRSEVYSELWHDFYTEMEGILINITDGRMTVCDSIAGYFLTRYGAENFVAVRNLPSIELLPPPSILSRRNSPRKLLYHGAYSINRGLEEIIAAAEDIRDAEIILRGFGPEEQALRKLVQQRGVGKKVSFSPPVPVEEIIPRAAECDIGLAFFPPVCRNLEYVLPNKFFEYMMSGLALASSDMVEMRKLINAHDAGVLLDFEKPDRLAGSLNDLISDPDRLDSYRRNAYEAARSELHWEREEKKVFELYANIIQA